MEPKTKYNVLFAASEADPLVKVGGLGDVAGSLPAALRCLPSSADYPNLDVRLVIPFHSTVRQKVKDAKLVAEFSVPHPRKKLNGFAYQTQVNDLPVYLIGGDLIPEDEPVYSPDHRTDALKYVFFSVAILEMAKALKWPLDILHVNDWHTALAAYVLKLRKPTDPFFEYTGSLLSIHNLPFMGAAAEKVVAEFGIPPTKDPKMPVWSWQIPLPMGLQAADRIMAVSPTYADEILTPEFGCDLQQFLMTRHRDLGGILNGLDTRTWDPETDNNIPSRFSEDNLSARAINKQALLDEFQLESNPSVPLLILIGRFDRQKGVDIALGGLRLIKDLSWQIIMLGTGDPLLEESAHKMEAELPGKVRAALRFDAALARRMYAGGDILLMPSRYEPCGLAQMIAMRYGCLPLARATGGLRDTITDDPKGDSNTGFLFAAASPEAFAARLTRALEQFKDQAAWVKMQQRAMRLDFSWQKSALAYAKLYYQIREGEL